MQRAQTLADQRRRNIGHEDQDGLAVRKRFHEGRQHIGRAGAGGDDDHSGPARGPRVAVGHEARALLVAGEDVGDVVLADQRVVDGEVVDAGQAEDVADALGAENFDDPLAAGAQRSPAQAGFLPGRSATGKPAFFHAAKPPSIS